MCAREAFENQLVQVAGASAEVGVAKPISEAFRDERAYLCEQRTPLRGMCLLALNPVGDERFVGPIMVFLMFVDRAALVVLVGRFHFRLPGPSLGSYTRGSRVP